MNKKLLIFLVLISIVFVSFFKLQRERRSQRLQEGTQNPHLVIVVSPGGIVEEEGRRYFMYDLVTKSLSDLPSNHPYFSESEEEDNEPWIKDDYLKELFGLGSDASTFQEIYLEDAEGSYVVSSYEDGVTSYWSFNPFTKDYKLLYSGKNLVCDGDIIDWDSQESKVLVLKKKQSLQDSSSDDVSGICVYDYANKKQTVNISVPLTWEESYAVGWGKLSLGKIVLSGNDNILIVDLNNSKKQLTTNAHILNVSEGMINKKGLLMLQKKGQDSYEIEIYDLNQERYLPLVTIDKNVFDGEAGDYLELADISYYEDELNIIEYTAYNPYRECWFRFNLSGQSEKLVCTDEIYSKFYKEGNFDRFRTFVSGYYYF